LKAPNTKKRAGGVAQVVGCLPSKHEALNSNPSDAKKKSQFHSVGKGQSLQQMLAAKLDLHMQKKEVALI
jgi:hypothetical protein